MRKRTLHSSLRSWRASAAVGLVATAILLFAAPGFAADYTAFTAALAPEPAAWMTTTLGLLGLEWMGRRNRALDA